MNLRDLPPNVAIILDSQSFCSERCVHAFFLETIETFDALSASDAAQMVTDLHQIYQTTVQTFAKLLEQPSPRN